MGLHTVMILDDEDWIVKGLMDIVDWPAEGFSILGGFTDPVEALNEIRKSEPDILLLDIKMPKMNGDTLMEMIREEGLSCEFMILSGYSDFSIAKRAMQHGAFDYILKPFEKQELLDALRRISKILTKRKSNKHSKPVDPKNSYEVLLQLASSELDGYTSYRVLLANRERCLTQPSLEGVAFFGPVPCLGGKSIWLIAVSENEPSDLSNYLENWAKDNQLSLGVSKSTRSMNKYHSMYRQANCALCGTYLLEREGCYFYTSPDLGEVKHWQERLLEVYRSDDEKMVRNEIINLIERWKTQGNPASISLLITLLTYGIASETSDAEDHSQIEIVLFDDISSQYSNVGELFDHLLMLMSVGEGQSRSSKLTMSVPQTIRDIRRYLLEHYSEELNLGRLSSQFFLTPSYLSELFRRYTGETITRYLLKIRMEKAAVLLASSEQSLASISEELGYNDYNYFSRLFKRYFGISPAKYRKNQQKSPGD